MTANAFNILSLQGTKMILVFSAQLLSSYKLSPPYVSRSWVTSEVKRESAVRSDCKHGLYCVKCEFWFCVGSPFDVRKTKSLQVLMDFQIFPFLYSVVIELTVNGKAVSLL